MKHATLSFTEQTDTLGLGKSVMSVDYADVPDLWAPLTFDVAQPEIGVASFCLSPEQCARLRDFLNEHFPKADTE